MVQQFDLDTPIKVAVYHHHQQQQQHHHKHRGWDPLIRSVSRVTTILANVSSVFQLFSFLVVCSDMISKGLGFVAFFASVKASSVCIRHTVQYAFSLYFTAYGVVCFVVMKGVACQRSQ
jgi:hypothetical protein